MSFEPIYCPNDRCPKYRDTGKRQIVARRSSDATGTLETHCPKCRQYSVVILRVLVHG